MPIKINDDLVRLKIEGQGMAIAGQRAEGVMSHYGTWRAGIIPRGGVRRRSRPSG
jgi:hypothetical protein